MGRYKEEKTGKEWKGERKKQAYNGMNTSSFKNHPYRNGISLILEAGKCCNYFYYKVLQHNWVD